MNYRLSPTKLGFKNFYNYFFKLKKEFDELQKKYSTLNNLQKHTQFRLDRAITIQVQRANSIRKLTPKRDHTGYILLEIKLNFYENKPLYRYKLETPVFYDYDLKEAQEMIIKDLEKILNLKFTCLKLNNISNRDDYIFYLMISKNINKKFYQVEFVTTKYLEEEQITLKR